VAEPVQQVRRARAAVGALFFANGAVFANAVPRYPDLKVELALSNTALGSAVAAFALGALLVAPLAGALVSRFGSARVAWVSAVGLAANVVLLGLAPSWWGLAAVLFVAGALDTSADLAGNAHGLRVERHYGRSILNSFHAVWSIGAVLGGVMGAAASGLQVPLVWHLAVVTVVFGATGLVASRFLLSDADHEDAPRTPGTRRLPLRQWWAIARSVLVFGGIATMAQVMEGAGDTWAAVYLRGELHTGAAVSGLGFIALQSAQTVGRLLGDRVVTRFGDRAVTRAGSALAGIAMAGALAWPAPVPTVVAFGLVGLGIGTLIPAGLRAADAVPGLPRGLGLALAGSVVRLAGLVVPPLVGAIADASSLRVGLIVLPLAAALAFLFAPALPGRRVAGRSAADAPAPSR
jgi:MFS family permease